MPMRVIDVVNALRKHDITGALLAPEDNVLTGPVDWVSFNGKGLAFYEGKDFSQLRNKDDPRKGLIICSASLTKYFNQGPFLFVENPRLAFALASRIFIDAERVEIHPHAVIDPRAKLGDRVSVGPLSVIGAAEIGGGTRIGSLVSITDYVRIGECVTIMNGAHLGDPGLGSIINQDGDLIVFPHFEHVAIEDNVVIGSGTIVNRGVLTTTVIGEGSHISANCTIGHNCCVGRRVFIAPGVSLGGRVEVGNNCFLGQGCCIREGVKLAKGITVGMNAVVTRSCLEEGSTLMSSPAKPVGDMFGLLKD